MARVSIRVLNGEKLIDINHCRLIILNFGVRMLSENISTKKKGRLRYLFLYVCTLTACSCGVQNSHFLFLLCHIVEFVECPDWELEVSFSV